MQLRKTAARQVVNYLLQICTINKEKTEKNTITATVSISSEEIHICLFL